MARRELIAAHRVLESYVCNQLLLDIDLQKPTSVNRRKAFKGESYLMFKRLMAFYACRKYPFSWT